jgi:hypothetical protein
MSDEFQVVMVGSMREPLTEWLRGRGMYLYPIPVEDDLPTFGIGTHLPSDMQAGDRIRLRASGTIPSSHATLTDGPPRN